MRHITRDVFYWALYDFANTAFSALFLTFFFPLYIKDFLGGNESQIGLVIGISMFLVGLIVPLIGAISDATGKRIPFIMLFTLLCVGATTLVGFLDLYSALFVALVANFFYHAALVTYDALLPHLSTKENVGFISGFGVGVGYVGTLCSLAMAGLIIWALGTGTLSGVRAVFIATAIFFFLFSLPLLLWVKEQKTKQQHFGTAVRSALSSLKSTYQSIHRFRGLGFFLAASFMYNDAMNTVILFLYLYGQEQIGLSVQQFFIIYAIVALCAFLGSIAFGKITDHIGPKKTLYVALFIWLGVVFGLMGVSNVILFTILSSLGGVVLGALWTANRPMLLSLCPRTSAGQFFGFLNLTEKFSGVVGPIVFGFVAHHHGYTGALWILVVFFVAGMLLLRPVPDYFSSR